MCVGREDKRKNGRILLQFLLVCAHGFGKLGSLQAHNLVKRVQNKIINQDGVEVLRGIPFL